MVDILVRNVEEAVAARMKDKAAAAGVSLNEMAREAFRQMVMPSKAEILAEIDRVRAMTPRRLSDSTPLIREDRDNDEPYR
jgi:plasmid stability protein